MRFNLYRKLKELYLFNTSIWTMHRHFTVKLRMCRRIHFGMHCMWFNGTVCVHDLSFVLWEILCWLCLFLFLIFFVPISEIQIWVLIRGLYKLKPNRNTHSFTEFVFKFFYEVWTFHLCIRNPCIMSFCVSMPFQQVFNLIE